MPFLTRLDAILGALVPLQEPAIHLETLLTEGRGRYTAEEWARARRRGYRGVGMDGKRLKDDVSYILRLLSHDTQLRNIVSAHRLAGSVDLESYGSVLEIGCGEMAQAIVLKALLPGLEYEATDIDSFVVDKMTGLSITDGIKTAVLDVRELSPERLEGYRCLLSLEVIYALEKEDLCRILRVCREAGVDFLAATSQLTGPLAWLYRRVKYAALGIREGVKRDDGSVLRAHGSKCSVGYYRRLGHSEGMHLRKVLYPPLCRAAGDDFAWLLFSVPGRA